MEVEGPLTSGPFFLMVAIMRVSIANNTIPKVTNR
jgi:hypothetical protein